MLEDKREKNDHKIQKYGITVSQKNAILRRRVESHT